MKLELSATGVLAVAGIAVAGLVLWRLAGPARELGQAARDLVARDLNPASPDNVVSRTLDALGESITGDPDWTLGAQVFDWTHTDPDDPTRFTALDAVNPASQDNLVNRALTDGVRKVTGDPQWTLGGWIYDVTH